ncbi:DinB family protein (plasmid) [Calothrix sp. NIES-4071]|nr:DinB family protein [Calothrix sp. NIES-4071]BAZ64921.1 DinB family protein [Calothrix sp. NIES-4105]
MITSNFLETMASYNKWQNENLFSICDDLSDEQLRLNRGMFFDSIFKTLNHMNISGHCRVSLWKDKSVARGTSLNKAYK